MLEKILILPNVQTAQLLKTSEKRKTSATVTKANGAPYATNLNNPMLIS
jgi:hypothetical protein